MDNIKISITVGDHTFTFAKDLDIGKELKLLGRRSALCDGQYGAMSISPEVGELQAAMTAHRIATLESHLITAGEGFEGFTRLGAKELVSIWEEFADKAGLFRKDDSTGSKGKKDTDTEDNPE